MLGSREMLECCGEMLGSCSLVSVSPGGCMHEHGDILGRPW